MKCPIVIGYAARINRGELSLAAAKLAEPRKFRAILLRLMVQHEWSAGCIAQSAVRS